MAAPAAAAPNTSQTSLSPVAGPPAPPPQHQHQQPPPGNQPSASLSPPPSHPASLASASPSKTSLTNWWKGFKSKPLFRKGEDQEHAPKGIFGVSLNTSIEYAYVNISITNPSGNSEVYGRIPIIVAKCGVYLKERATDVEGIFRVSGSAKRIKELQAFFDSPPTYGKTLDWDGFNVHDAANVFRRYINHLPESIIPHDYYFAFRQPLEVENPDVEQTIRTYQKLIGDLPKLNGQLLLYILDLLAVFAENSAQNLMPATNLAAIFQPGLLSHPDHDMDPQQYKLSQEVLMFLIEHQDRFLPTSATQPRDKSPARPPPPEQHIAPPAQYSGPHPPKEIPAQQINIPRRRTMPKKPDASPFPSNVLRRHRSNRTPRSPKLAVEEEEPRRVSEGSAPSNPGDQDRRPSLAGLAKPPDRSLSFEKDKEDVLSSPVIQSALPTQTEESAETVPVTESTEADITATPQPANHVTQPVPGPNHVIDVTGSNTHNDVKAPFLAVSSVPMGRSSSYKEELDEIIDYGDHTTSTDVTEAETSDGASKSEKKQKRRLSRLPLPWSSNSDLPGDSKESKVNSLFSFATAPAGEDGKAAKKLQKKKRPKDMEGAFNAIDLAVGIGRPGIVSTPASELSQSERGLGTPSPQPFLHQSNISQSSLHASEFSRRSHISSTRSSVEHPRAATPLERRPVSLTPTTLEEIRQQNLQHNLDDDLPTKVIMPAAREDRPRASSQSSTTSAGSSSKGSKIGAWLRKKRGMSVSSSTSAGGGGGGVVSQ